MNNMPVMVKTASIRFEEQCHFSRSAKVMGHIQVGAFTYFGDNCIIGDMEIGRFCSVAPNVIIGLGEHEYEYVSTHPFFYASNHVFKNIPAGIGKPRDLSLSKHQRPIIGNDVWIGANVVICRGVHIGDGAVIAAGAVVTKDIEPYTIYGGVPAKKIRMRFEPHLVSELKHIKWWNYALDSFVGLDPSDLTDFITNIKKLGPDHLISYPRYFIKDNLLTML